MEKAKLKIFQSLQHIYPEHEIRSISRLILSEITGYSFTGLITNKNSVFSENQRELLDKYLEKLKMHVPVQYVLGKTEFYGLPFFVNSDVLIPRPETEELVHWIISDYQHQNVSVLDLGTGSGCIPVALKHELPFAQIFACDISEKALEIAGKNAENNQTDVHFFTFDILNDKQLPQHFDVFVSNPPYVLQSEMQQMEAHVVENEPHLALFVPDQDPLLFYAKIADLCDTYLIPGGKLYFEIHKDFGVECVQMLESKGFKDVELRRDLSGLNRMIRAVKPFSC